MVPVQDEAELEQADSHEPRSKGVSNGAHREGGNVGSGEDAPPGGRACDGDRAQQLLMSATPTAKNRTLHPLPSSPAQGQSKTPPGGRPGLGTQNFQNEQPGGLPPGWVATFSAVYQTDFYHNEATGMSTWEPPVAVPGGDKPSSTTVALQLGPHKRQASE